MLNYRAVARRDSTFLYSPSGVTSGLAVVVVSGSGIVGTITGSSTSGVGVTGVAGVSIGFVSVLLVSSGVTVGGFVTSASGTAGFVFVSTVSSGTSTTFIPLFYTWSGNIYTTA